MIDMRPSLPISGKINGHSFVCPASAWTPVPRVVAWALAGLGHRFEVREPR